MIDQARTREILCYICWKEQSAQQYGACGQLATTYLRYILLWEAEIKQQKETSYIVRDKYDYINFSIDYLIRTMCLLSRVLHNTFPHLRLQLLSDKITSR